jgi:hypothetical protein
MKNNILSQVSHSFEKKTLFYFILFYFIGKNIHHISTWVLKGGGRIFLTIFLHFGEILQTCPQSNSKSFLGCLHMMQYKKFGKRKQCLKVLKMKHDFSSTHQIHSFLRVPTGFRSCSRVSPPLWGPFVHMMTFKLVSHFMLFNSAACLWVGLGE